MSFPLNPVDGARTIVNGIKYVYTAATNSWRRDFNNVLDRLFLVGGNQAVNTSTGDLVVTGGGAFGKNLYVGGNLFVAGTSTTFSSFIVGSISTATSASNLLGGARGSLVFQTTASTTGFIPISTTGSILMSNGVIPIWTASAAISVAQATSATNIVGGAQYQVPYQAGVNLTTFSPNFTYNNATLSIKNTTTSIDVASGALVVSGGVGISGDVYIGGSLQINGVATYVSSTNVSIVDKNIVIAQGSINAAAANGAGFTVDTPSNKPQIYYQSTDDSWNLNKALNLSAGIQSSSTLTGTLRVIGGAGIAGDLFAGSLRGPLTGTVGAGTKNAGAFTTVQVVATTVSTGTATGALTVAGGVGIAGDLYVGGLVVGTVSSTLLATTASYAIQAQSAVTANSALVSNLATVATNIGGGAAGRIPYQSATSSTTFSQNLTFDGTNLQTTKITVAQNDAVSLLPTYSTGLILANGSIDQSPVFKLSGSTTGFAFVSSVGTLKIMQDASSLTNSLLNISLTSVNVPILTASTSSTSGALTVAGGVGIAGKLNVGGTSTFAGSILPSADVTYDLGSPTAKWRSVYVSTSTVYLGSNSLSVDKNTVLVNGLTVSKSNFNSYSLTDIDSGAGNGQIQWTGNQLKISNCNSVALTNALFILTPGKKISVRTASGATQSLTVVTSATNTITNVISIGVNTVAPYDTTYDYLDIPPSPPVTSSSSGVMGQIAYDNNYVYICVADNTWRRFAASTF